MAHSVRGRRRPILKAAVRGFAQLAIFGPILSLSLLALPPAGAGAPDADYLDELVARTRAEGVAASLDWLALGYYMPDALGGASSLIDNSAFFLSADGKTDPTAELEATLAAFFAPAAPGDPDNHPQCLKVARYRWLKERLAFDPERLTEQACPAYAEWQAAFEPGRVTLIFPAAYLNNPSSMFGHTLIRFDPPEHRSHAPLNAYTVHFAADHQGEGGLIFAVKGMNGGYRGYFSRLRYYEKVTQYGDIENRDIWEYELDIPPERIRMMMASLWEVDLQPVDYYFLSTNCSYVLLQLLNIARPDLRLSSRFPVYAIPTDTVRAVVDGTGLLRHAVFRPSQLSRISYRWSLLDDDEQDLVLRLSNGELAPDDAEVVALAPSRQARAVELAQAYLQYQLDTGAIDRVRMAPRSLALLRARASMAETSPPPPVPEPAARPDQGHRTARLTVGTGMTGDRPFAEVALRSAYHDLLDPAPGYTAGAAIEFLDLSLRWYDSAVPQVEQATLLRVESLSARETLFQPISWRFRIGAERFRARGSQPGDLTAGIWGGAGATWPLSVDARIYTFADAALLGDQHWPNGRLFAIGPSAGLLWSPTSWWTVHPHARAMLLIEGGPRDAFEAALEQSFALDRNLAFKVSVAARNDGGATYGEWSTLLAWYF